MSGKTDSKPLTLRLAATSDIPQLCDIETSAAAKFASIPELAFIADGVPHDVHASEKVQTWMDQGRVYLVEEGERGNAVGFIAAIPMDTSLLISEISVALDQNGRGVGTQLVEAVFAWARERAAALESKGKARVSLTTYPDVPWNGPWYAKRGFKEVRPEELGPKHVAKMLVDEEERGLVQPNYRRACMMIELE